MKHFITLLLTTALCTPVFAQKSGSSNRNAPAIEQSITIGANKMALNYTSITWAKGKTMEMAMDKANGAGAREMINGNAVRAPLATFTSTVAVECGELKLDAGEYKVYFTISDDCDWNINFQGKDKDAVQTMKLPLADSPEDHARLLMCLYAADAGDGAGVYVAFGKKMGMLEFKAAAKKA